MKRIKLASIIFFISLLLFISCDMNGHKKHTHVYQGSMHVCSCGAIDPAVIAYTGISKNSATARFLSLSEAVNYVSSIQKSRDAQDYLVHSCVPSITCNGLTINGIDIDFDFTNTTVKFTESSGIVVNGGTVTVSGGSFQQSSKSEPLFTVKSGSLKIESDFTGSIKAGPTALVEIAGGKAEIEGIDSPTKNIKLTAKSVTLCMSVDKAYMMSALITDDSTSKPVIKGHLHDVKKFESTESTCSTRGNKEYWYCSECKRYFADAACTDLINDIDTLSIPIVSDAHDWGPWQVTKEATHEADGVETRVCKNNPNHKESRIIPASGENHPFSTQWSSDDNYHWHDVTCSHTGITSDKALHDWKLASHTDASCTSEGLNTYECSVCGKTKEETVPQLAHSLEYVSAVAPTCTEKGVVEHWHCETCNTDFSDANATNILSSVSVAVVADAHVWGSWEASDPTHTEAGIATRTCLLNPEHIETKEIPASGHAWDDGVVTKPATCTEKGILTYTCPCGATKTDLIEIDSDNHSFSTSWSSDDTYHWHAATCGHDEVKDKAEHSWNSGVVTKQPSCTQKGEKTYTCLICGKTKTEDIDMIDHNTTHVGAKSANCTESGNIEYWYCSECNKYFRDAACTKSISGSATVVSASGHKKTHIAAKAATCTEDGNIEYWHCANCGKDFKDEACTQEAQRTVISALGHDWQLDAEGNHYCARSGCSEATAHTPNYSTRELCNCDNSGKEHYHYYCSSCGEYYTFSSNQVSLTEGGSINIFVGKDGVICGYLRYEDWGDHALIWYDPNPGSEHVSVNGCYLVPSSKSLTKNSEGKYILNYTEGVDSYRVQLLLQANMSSLTISKTITR